MVERFKKFHWIAILSLLILGTGYTLAFAIDMTVDGKDDAGSFPGEGAFARFVDASNPGTSFGEVTTTTPQFLSASDAAAYANTLFQPGVEKPWLLHSAGNIWSATDLIVGESLSGLHAGTYRITPKGGAYMYDSWAWSDAKYRYWWELHIRAQNAFENGQPVNSLDKILGSHDSQGSEGLA
jgi:hypothetical protein